MYTISGTVNFIATISLKGDSAIKLDFLGFLDVANAGGLNLADKVIQGEVLEANVTVADSEC